MYEGLYERSVERKQTARRTRVLKSMLRHASRSDVLDRIVDADPKLQQDPMLRSAVKAKIEEWAPAISKDRQERVEAEDYKRTHYRWWTLSAWRDKQSVGVKLGPVSVWMYHHRVWGRRCVGMSWLCGRERILWPLHAETRDVVDSWPSLTEWPQ